MKQIAFIDADVIVRFLTGDDLKKQAAAASLFEQVEQNELRITTPVTTIADVIYVLTSPRLYRVSRPKVAALLTALLSLAGFDMPQRESLLNALSLYGGSNLDFGDALIAASMLANDADILYSHDHDFDRLTGIKRVEP